MPHVSRRELLRTSGLARSPPPVHLEPIPGGIMP